MTAYKLFKKFICLVLAVSLVLSSLTVALAAPVFDESTGASAKKWLTLPLGDNVVNHSYHATDTAGSVTYDAFLAIDNSKPGVSIDNNGIVSFKSDAIEATSGDYFYRVKATGDGSVQSMPIYTYKPYETDFNSATVSNKIINEGGTDIFTDVSLVTEGSNSYIKGTNGLRFYFKKRFTDVSNTLIMEMDVNLGSNFFSVMIPGQGQTLVQFDRSYGFKKDDYDTSPLESYKNISVGWYNVKVILNWKTLKYSVIFDGELIYQNETLLGTPSSSGFRYYGADGVDNFKFYGSSLPQPYDVGFAASPKVGSVAKGKASSHTLSPVVTSGTPYNEYSYYISDTENGTYTQITSTDPTDDLYLTANGGLAIVGDYEGKYIKVGARVCDANGKTDEALSAPARVAACDSISLTAGTNTKNVRFKLTSDLSSQNITWSLPSYNGTDVSITSDGLLTVGSGASGDVYVKAADSQTGEAQMKKLDFVSYSDDGTDIAAAVYPVMFEADIDTSKITQLSAGGLTFAIADNKINGLDINDTFTFKLIFENNKYYAFADGNLISSASSTAKPLGLSANGDFDSYYAGSPLESEGAFIKCDIPSVVCEGNNVGADYEFYNESGIYPDSYTVEWYVDSSLTYTGDTFFVPYGNIGSEVYCKVTAGGASVISDTATIDSQYDLTIVQDGTYTIDLRSVDRDVYVILQGEDGSVFCADMSGGAITATLAPGQGYTMYFVNKDDLALRGMAVSISGNSHSDIITPYTNTYINYLTRAGMDGQTNSAALYEKPLSKAQLIADKFPEGTRGMLTDIIRDIYITSESCTSYGNSSSLPGGCYRLISIKDDGNTSETEFYNKKYQLFTSTDNFDYSGFATLTSEVLSISSDGAGEICDKLTLVANKDRVCTLVGTNENYFAPSVSLALISEHASPSDGAIDEAKAELNLAGLTNDFADLLKIADSYSSIMASVDYSFGIQSVTDGLKEAIILSEVKNAYNYKNIKQFLSHLGSSIYNSAGEDAQNYAAQAVYKQSYSSLALLKQAVEAAIGIYSPGGNTGGGGSAPSKPAVQSGSLSGTPTSPVVPQTPASVFSDVDRGHWAYAYIEQMSKQGIISGYDGKFRPEDTITRAEYVKLLCVAFGILASDDNSFADVASDDWYAPYVGGANKAGIVQGNGQGFNPNGTITREDASVMLWRLLQQRGVTASGGANPFEDSDFSSYSLQSVSELASLGIINGMDDRTFAPKLNITRAQAAKIIYLAMNMGGDK